MDADEIATGQMQQLRDAAQGAFGAMAPETGADSEIPGASSPLDGDDVRRVR